MEPAAMLVGAFQVKVGGKAAFRAFFHDSGKTCAGIKPNVKNVFFPFKMRSAAVRAFNAVRDDFAVLRFIPIVTACGVFCKTFCDFTHPCGILPCFAAILAKQRKNWDTPGSLAGNAPVGALFYHIVNSVFAPARYPFHIVADGI